MGEIHNIEEGIDHIVEELICIECKHRFLDVRPLTSWLKDLECPNCNKMGYLINTGEIVTDGQYEKVCEQYKRYHIYREYKQIYQEEMY